MKRVLIREDDINYFTPPEVLDRLYGRILARSLPVNLGVIPRVSGAIPLAFGTANPYFDGRLAYEPFIPPEFRGRRHTYEIGENGSLLEYVRGHPPLVVTQHGVTHDQADMGFLSGEAPGEFRRALRRGKAVLASAFGDAPAFFTPPWGRLSPTAIEVLRREFGGVSTGFTRRRFLPVPHWGRYLARRLRHRALYRWAGCLVVTHPFDLCRISFPDPANLLHHVIPALEQWDVLVLTNHHWEYLRDWSGWDQGRLSEWDRVVGYLLERADVRFETFATLEAACRADGGGS